MNVVRTLLIAALALFASVIRSPAAEPKPATLAEGPVVPVLAWGGVPQNESTPARFAELAACGFTHNYSGHSNADEMEKALDAGHGVGIKQVIAIPELERDPEGTAKRFKDHPGMGGYYLRDEPGAGLFAQLAAWAKRIQSVDQKNPAYVNLLPTYGNPGMWETPDYPTYVDRFIKEVPTPMLSFDHYPVFREGKDAPDQLRGDYYHNLEICSAAARKSGRPLWAFALATAHNPYPIPTVAHLRLQVYSNLAYGAQAIQYFTYWTIKSDVWNFHQGPIEQDGKRTPTYDRVKQVNQEFQALRGAFLGSKLISVAHTGGAIPYGTTRFSPAAPVKSLETPDGGGAVVSMLEKGTSRFLVVVNRDLHKPMPLRVAFDPAAGVKVAARDGALAPVKDASHAADLEPGDVVVFTWTSK